MSDKKRIIDLQKSLKIARDALTRIAAGTTRHERIAEETLTELWRLEPKQQLQGVVGHALSRPHSHPPEAK